MTILQRLARAEKRLDDLEGKLDDVADGWFDALKAIDDLRRFARVGVGLYRRLARRLRGLEDRLSARRLR